MYKPILTFLFLFIIHSSFAQNKKIIGFNEKNVDGQLSLESQFDKNLSAENIGATMKILSAKPHHISSPGSKANAEYILDLYKKWAGMRRLKRFMFYFQRPKPGNWK